MCLLWVSGALFCALYTVANQAGMHGSWGHLFKVCNGSRVTSCDYMLWYTTGMASCPYVLPTLLAPFSLPLMRALAKYLPDRSLREARSILRKV